MHCRLDLYRVTEHLYERQFLKPQEEIYLKRMHYVDMLEMLSLRPFEFYMMPIGYVVVHHLGHSTFK